MTFALTVLTIALIALCFAPGAYAFGAGEIPDYAYLADKAFRHGDIENTLKELYKVVGHGHVSFSGGAVGILSGLASVVKNSGGTKFNSMDIKRVYFGNWLCDYSQAMDIAGLSKLTAQSIITIVSALGFMTFGFATNEFQITAERLRVYLPVTHIDNPKGYGAGQDPRQTHQQLRPPVEDRELQIDGRNGMKKYIATEDEGFDSSTAELKRIFRWCIENGRRAKGQDGPDMWEAFRLLGIGLHTCEDLLAHSNWCELALRKMGYEEVFCHVGDNVKVDSPQGPVPPLVTGTFGSADFLHSLLGEATDHLSEASLTDLSKKLKQSSEDQSKQNPISTLMDIFGKIGGGGDKEEKLQQGEEMKQKAFDLQGKIDEAAPEDVQKQLWEILVWRDDIMRDVTETIQNVPGLEELMDQVTAAINIYVFTLLEPFLTPLLQNATGALQEGSSAIIDSNKEDQYAVFDSPDASDPSHSLLSKDHFALILNEPAGKIAMVVVKHAVQLIVAAWYDENANIDQVIGQTLEVFHHPYWANGNSQVQKDMQEALREWIEGMRPEDKEIVLQNLTKDSVRNGKNKRAGHEDDDTGVHSHGSGGGAYSAGGRTQGSQSQSQPQYGGGGYQRPQEESGGYQSGGYQRPQEESGGYQSGGYQSSQSHSEYQRPHEQQQQYGYNPPSSRNDESSDNTYGGGSRYGNESSNTYGNDNTQSSNTYGYNSSGSSNRYGREDNDNSSGNRRYGEEESSGYGRRGGETEDNSYGRHEQTSEYSRRGDDDNSYGRSQHESSGYGGGGRRDEDSGYSRRGDDDNSHGRSQHESSGYGQERETNTSWSASGGDEGYGGGGGRRHEGYGGGNEYDNSRSHRREEGGGNDETYGAERLNINDDGERSGGYGGGYGGGERRRERNEYESEY